MAQTFTEKDKQSLYSVIESRRDVRSGFSEKEIAKETLQKILFAAHHAPSVGFMQPWNFILVDDLEIKLKVKDSFDLSRSKESALFSGDRKELYDSLKLEGIMESPLNILVTCERDRSGRNGLGRSQQKDMDLFSTVCAIQNMWLAARVEGIGLGWVSILDTASLKEIFELPENVEPVAYLCLGYVDEFSEKPELENAGWEKRLDLNDLIFKNSWGNYA